MSSKGRKNDHQSGVPYREDSKTRGQEYFSDKRIEANSHHIPGQHAYAGDKESPSALSETEAREAKNRYEPS